MVHAWQLPAAARWASCLGAASGLAWSSVRMSRVRAWTLSYPSSIGSGHAVGQG